MEWVLLVSLAVIACAVMFMLGRGHTKEKLKKEAQERLRKEGADFRRRVLEKEKESWPCATQPVMKPYDEHTPLRKPGPATARAMSATRPYTATDVKKDTDDFWDRQVYTIGALPRFSAEAPSPPEPERGGDFGGAGASGSWSEPSKPAESSPSLDSSSSSSDSSSSSSSDSGSSSSSFD